MTKKSSIFPGFEPEDQPTFGCSPVFQISFAHPSLPYYLFSAVDLIPYGFKPITMTQFYGGIST